MQFVFSFNPLLSIVMPQVVYHCECLMVVCLTILVNSRLKRLTRKQNLSRVLAHRMKFYIQMNNLTACFVFLDFFSLGIINADILTGIKAIATNPFWTDLFTHGFSTGITIAIFILFCIMFPPELPQSEVTRTTRFTTAANWKMAAAKRTINESSYETTAEPAGGAAGNAI
jgi:hypothetical protein